MLAIVMPVFEAPHRTNRQLQLLAEQTTDRFEVFIVNDGGREDYYSQLEIPSSLQVHYIYFGPKTSAFRADITMNVVAVRLDQRFNRLLRFDDDFFPTANVVEEHLRFGSHPTIVCGLGYTVPETMLEVPNFPTGYDPRRLAGEVPRSAYSSAWGFNVSYPLHLFHKAGGVDSYYIGKRLNGETDLAARLVHWYGAQVAIWPKAYGLISVLEEHFKYYPYCKENGFENLVPFAFNHFGILSLYHETANYLESKLGFPVAKLAEVKIPEFPTYASLDSIVEITR